MYADIVKGDCKVADINGKKDMNMESTRKQFHSVGKGKVMLEDKDCYEITVIPKEEDRETAKRTLIGEVSNFDLLQNILEMPKVEGLFNVSLRTFYVMLSLPGATESGDRQVDRCNNNNFNKEVRRMGILTSESSWINEVICIKVEGLCFKIKVFEESARSISLGPKIWNIDMDQSSDKGWSDKDDEGLGDDEVVEETEEISTVGIPKVLDGIRRDSSRDRPEESKVDGRSDSWQKIKDLINYHGDSVKTLPGETNSNKADSLGGSFGSKPIVNISGENFLSPNDKDSYVLPVGPEKVDMRAPLVPDLNSTPQSSGFYPFVDLEDNLDDDFDFGEEDDVEQALEDEIDRKRRRKKKGETKKQEAKEVVETRGIEKRKVTDPTTTRTRMKWRRRMQLERN
ncbi:hypothetical protein L1887_16389 [Cichorium endivia]|nr:hypothetical protein L1887_16389 [Cichorium endivia]